LTLAAAGHTTNLLFGYHPKMGGYPDLYNHLLAIVNTPSNTGSSPHGESTGLASRIFWGAVSLLLLAILGAALYGRFTDPEHFRDPNLQGAASSIWNLVITEFLSVMFVFFSLEFVWAIAKPKWLERFRDKVMWKAILLFLVLFLTCVVFSLCGL
jgi:hypothetical protein